MAHTGRAATPSTQVATRTARVCETCGRRLKPVYPNLVSLGAREAFVQAKLVCPAGCELWVYVPELDAWIRSFDIS